MAKLSYIDKTQLESLLGMGSGYVLDFKDDQYADFFREQGINIEADQYHKNGRSKAKRMRAFWELGTDVEVSRVLKALFDYIEIVKPIEAGGVLEDSHRGIAQRLIGCEEPVAKAPLNEKDFLAAEFGNARIGLLNLEPAIEKAVKQRMDEIQSCLRNDSPLAAILLSGSTLEALLLNAATRKPHQYNVANATPKSPSGSAKQFHEWSLNDFINVAHEVGDIGLDVKKFSHALRDFRNYIHPYEQASSRFSPDKHTAKISWQVLQAAIAHLSETR